MIRNLILAAVFLSAHFSLFSQQVVCDRTAKFGTADICLPAIEGYTECYTDPQVKPLADATEVPLNMVLGYYINDATYENIEAIDKMEDYFKVYGTKQLKDLPATTKEISEMGEMLKGSFITKNWEELAKDIKIEGLDMEVGVPVVVKSYNINDESFSIIMIVKYAIEGAEPYDVVLTVNGFLSNDRLVWMAYYLLFEGEETVKEIESKSNEILSVLQKAGA